MRKRVWFSFFNDAAVLISGESIRFIAHDFDSIQIVQESLDFVAAFSYINRSLVLYPEFTHWQGKESGIHCVFCTCA